MTDSNTVILWIMLLATLVGLYLMIKGLIIFMKNRRNPDAHPPVMGNVKTLTDQQLAGAIEQHINKGQKILEIKRGFLARNSGPKKIKVDMEFGDGKNRWVYLQPGERVTKVTIENANGNTHIEFWREHCGNYFAVIKRGRVELPKGWEFQSTSTTGPFNKVCLAAFCPLYI